jgi:oxygen-independent coproporphyrinogen-3 oxidase
VQDFDPTVQKVVNRIQPEALTRDVVTESRKLGFDSINIDLIYGLPYQTVESFASTIDKVIEISPDRLAIFNYAHVPWMKRHQKVIPSEHTPSPEVKLEMLQMATNKLTAAGYEYIGMDHFAKENDELTRALKNHTLHRNFQGYTTRCGAEVYAMGITSISQLDNCYAQNAKTTQEYKAFLSQEKIPTVLGYHLSEDDKVRRFCIMEIMCNNRLLKSVVEECFRVVFDDYFAEALEELRAYVEDGLITLLPDRIEVSETGRFTLRNIAMAFDRYLKQDQKSKQPMYSRTV